MKTIPLTRGLVAVVDDEDYDFLMQWKWYAAKSWGDKFRAERNLSAEESRVLGKGHGIRRMHHEVMRVPSGTMLDHVNGDPLNNMRANIRPATRATNGMNRGRQVNNSSGYKGVRLWRHKHYTRTKPWVAQLGQGGRPVYKSYHATAEEAARAYDAAALKYHGEFACINFPTPAHSEAQSQ